MSYYVYIIQSKKTGRYYIGSTKYVLNRVLEHNQSKVRSTRKRGPWIKVYSEEFLTRKEAIRREMKIKSYKGGEAFKRLVSE